MDMDSSQRQRLESALLLAFPDRESLNRMLFYKLSVSLDEIGDDNKQQNRLTNVVNWALNQNRLYQFLSGVLEQRPEDAGLRTIVLEISTQERSRLRQEWQDRVGRLQQLLDTSELPELRSSLEKLFSWSSAKTLNVESTLPKLGLSTFDALLDLIKRMHEDIAAGANP